MKTEDFNLDFDFEKEYGFAEQPQDNAGTASDIDFDAMFSAEFGNDNFQYDELAPLESYADLPAEEEPAAEEVPVQEPASAPAAPSDVPPLRRRKKRSKMQRFKEELLPLIIAGVAGLMILIFIGGAIGRTISANRDAQQASKDAAESLVDAETALAMEAESLKEEAALLAAGYDYQGAIAALDSYSGAELPEELSNLRSQYAQLDTTLISWNDPGAVANLSFHPLIVDSARAFNDEEFGSSYNKNFVTVGEFSAILEQLYARGYVLVDFDSFVAEVEDGESVSYTSKPIRLPDGKKPVMISETLVNYFAYMVDSNDDGTADAGGAGFAHRLVVKNGKILAEYVDADGNTLTGNYDLVPILNDFIEAHPDFAYQGARATLAVTGYEGVFGYRTNRKVIETKGQSYYDEQVKGAQALVAALRDEGYNIACFTYSNMDYGKNAATAIQADLDSWKAEVTPVIGDVDILIYARESDISPYSGGKYDVLHGEGFRYFVGSANKPSAVVTTEYVHQTRIMVTGTKMANTPDVLADYFDAGSVLDTTRGNVVHD